MRAEKYVILLGDGMPDRPIPEKDNKTPLMLAATPNLDRLARKGTAGGVRTTPEGFEPGSDVTNLGIMGYDAAKYYTGRAPLEAAAMGIDLGPEDVAFRLNLVTLKPSAGGVIMDDFSAGHIGTGEAGELIGALQRELGGDTVSFHPGVSYRHLMVWRGGESGARLTPPHDISDKSILGHMPEGAGAEFLTRLMSDAQILLKNHEVNRRREARGDKPANSVWFWGQGKAPSMPTLAERKGLSGAMITAVDLMRGIGVYAGMRIINVPGATGWIDTNYEGKAAACLEALKEVDFVFVHVESPDEAGHAGSLEKKVQAIEDFDAKVVGPVLSGLEKAGLPFRVMALSDHPTPLDVKTHTTDPVVFAIYPALEEAPAASFDESVLETSPLFFDRATGLSDYFIEGER